MGYDFEPRGIESFDIEGDGAPEIGELVARYRRADMPPGEFITDYGSGPWLVAEVLEISYRPGWVRVFVVPAEGMMDPPWEEEVPA
jgi:hypothetical protein